MGNGVKHLGDLFMKDEHGEFHKVGEFGEMAVSFDSDKAMETEYSAELEECEPDGICIHITGSQINKINNIDIDLYMKEEK